jgi:hypothetical protein
MKNIFINSKRYLAIAIGFLFLISFIPYLNYNVYGQTTQQLINGNGQGTITSICPTSPQLTAPGTITFNAFGLSTGQVTSGTLQISSSLTGTINGQIQFGLVNPNQYQLNGQFTSNICPSLGTTFPFFLEGPCSING